MQKTVLSFGEILWDILPAKTVLGGAPFNFTYRINSLGDKGLMISRLGKDEYGEKAFQAVQSLKMDTQFIQWDDLHDTGSVNVSFDENNNPDYVIIPDVAYDFVELTDELLNAAVNADCLCFGTLAQRNQTSRQALYQLIDAASMAIKFYDINLRKDCFSPETIRYSLDRSDILKLNENEALQLAKILKFQFESIPQFCEQMIASCDLEFCMVTLAENGSFACSRTGQAVYVPGFQIELVDSLGSGDAFSAGFIHKILRGESLQQACEFGNALGAIVATQQGATSLIDREDIIQFNQLKFARNINQKFEKFILG